MEAKDKNDLYAICKQKETKEYHIFLTYIGKDQKCYFSKKESICGAMQIADKENCILSCATEAQVRQKAADIGDTVCGNCMKTIFKT